MTIHQPGGHLDQMLRQTRIHHVQLSSMADIKANMLLTVASLIITLAAPHFANPNLRWAILSMIVFCLATIALAIYTVMPKVRGHASSAEDEAGGRPGFNLLFFGDFAEMPYEQFEARMEKVLNDPSHLYEVQVREIYTLGTFLAAKKYRPLRMAYLTFLAGLFVSVGVFLGGLL
jgi:hypothetical protein